MRILLGLIVALTFGVGGRDALAADIIALSGGQLITGRDEAPIPKAVVLIEGNRILAAGPVADIALPEGVTVIDTTGQTMMPGLIDLHIHLDLIGHGDYDRYYTWMDNMRRLPEVFPIAAKGMMRAGVTTGVDLGSTFHILAARERIRAGEIPGPRLVISGPWITRIHMDGIPDGYQLVVTSPEEAREAVRWLIKEGADVIKTWEGLTLEDRLAISDEAHKAGLKVHAHLYETQDIRDALATGVDVLQHVGSALNAPYPKDVIDAIVKRRIPIVQTISHRIWIHPATEADPARLQHPVLRADLSDELYDEMQQSFENRAGLSYYRHIEDEMAAAKLAAPQFIAAGAYMGVGTDAASPLNFHHDAMGWEIRALVESGMTPAQVLQAATRVGAEIIDRADDLGTVEAGKLADLIIIDGDPLADIADIHKVTVTIKDGVPWFDPSNATAALTKVGRAYGSE